MTPLYSVAEIRQIEQSALALSEQPSLMQRAGQAAATHALTLITIPVELTKILIVAGPGNNGGDALECACRLAQVGASVYVIMIAEMEKQSADRALALQNARSSSAQFVDVPTISDAINLILSTHWNLIVDGLFGIGLRQAISGDLRQIVDAINAIHKTNFNPAANTRPRCPILALDVPSGLNADTGHIVDEIVGEGSAEPSYAIRASNTITFIGDKPGLHTCYGQDYAGSVTVAPLDIDTKYFPQTKACLNNTELFSQRLHPRLRNSHKGSFGDVAVLGGAHGMAGAAILSARAALHCGAGRVFIAFCDAGPAYDSTQPELMCRAASDFDYSLATLVAGPGLGNSSDAIGFLTKAILANTSVVLDADALNLIAADASLANSVPQRTSPTVMTPHPLEAARLLGISGAEVQADRLEAARTLARRFKAIVILKGSGTVIVDANGMVVINTTGNPALATAGTGDVLAGMCGALLAQHWSAWEAALAAVWIHGRAADVLVQEGVGPIGLSASELIPAVRCVLNQLHTGLSSSG